MKERLEEGKKGRGEKGLGIDREEKRVREGSREEWEREERDRKVEGGEGDVPHS